MMVFVVGAAVGFASTGPRGADFTGGLLAAVAFWFALGLVNQARDLWATFRGRAELTNEERWGWRFAAAWRAGLACILAGHVILKYVVDREIPPQGSTWNTFYWFGNDLRDALPLTCLLIGLIGFGGSTAIERAPKRRRLWLALISWIFALVACFVIWSQQLLIHFLVFIALVSVEFSESLKVPLGDADPNVMARVARFFGISALAGVAVLTDLAVASRLARSWPTTRLGKWATLAVLVPSLFVTIWYPAWVYASGAAGVSPPMGEVVGEGPVWAWYTAFLLLLVLATAGTYRLFYCASDKTIDRVDMPQRDPRIYLQQQFLFAAAACIIVVAWLGQLLWGVYRELEHLTSITTVPFTLADFAVASADLLTFPFFYLLLALLIVSTKIVFSTWRGRDVAKQHVFVPVECRRFVLAWIILCLATECGTVVATALSFTVWVMPWWH